MVSGAYTADTSGAAVQAHGGGIIKVGQYYYWFGENRNADGTFRYVSAYRSTDLRVWELRNHVLRQSSAAELNVANIERPKVVYNAATGRFVMWMHKENGADYSQARAPWRCRPLWTVITPILAASGRWATCPATSRRLWTPTAPDT